MIRIFEGISGAIRAKVNSGYSGGLAPRNIPNALPWRNKLGHPNVPEIPSNIRTIFGCGLGGSLSEYPEYTSNIRPIFGIFGGTTTPEHSGRCDTPVSKILTSFGGTALMFFLKSHFKFLKIVFFFYVGCCSYTRWFNAKCTAVETRRLLYGKILGG